MLFRPRAVVIDVEDDDDARFAKQWDRSSNHSITEMELRPGARFRSETEAENLGEMSKNVFDDCDVIE